MTTHHNNYEIAARKIVDHVGKVIVIGVPLGIGKPIGLLNALYRLAESDQSINLTIMTALTFSRPAIKNELEKRLVEPILDRMIRDHEEPLYEKARKSQQLPGNIRVIEFFLTPGQYLHNDYVQQNYISESYSNVVNDSSIYAVNVIAQQITHSKLNPKQYSLSCNTDLFHQLVEQLKKFELENKKIAIVAEINLHLPFMPGEDAVVAADVFTDIIDTGHYKTLFAIPRDELSAQDHLIGLYTSCLIKDDSCIQLGIGKLNNAIANALIMRHSHNEVYLDALKQLSVNEKFGKTIASVGSSDSFDKGLYASTEMLSDDYMHLYKEGVLKKRVYDHIGLQRLLNTQKIKEWITPDIIDILLKNKIINSKLTTADVEFLLKFGIFKTDIRYHEDNLILPSGEKISADLTLIQAKQKIIESCLGEHLKTGKVIHAGFFVGSSEFYQQLHNLPLAELQQIAMTSIVRTNTLLWSYELSKLQRQHTRFINFAMMVTLGGAVVSDGLQDLREVSGVGGQFDFVNMAFTLPEARSVIVCRSVRETNNQLASNIVWEYANQTIPRYLRDIVVTEYGIADCRGKTDSEVIQSLLNITDSRFQDALLLKAKKSGKLSKNYEIPDCFRRNYPAVIIPVIQKLQVKGYFKPYPFGSDLTQDEQVIEHALLYLKSRTKFNLMMLALASLLFFSNTDKFNPYLQRMNLQHPKNIKDFFFKKLLQMAIKNSFTGYCRG